MKSILYAFKHFKFDILTTLSTIGLVSLAILLWQNQLTLMLTSVLMVTIFLIIIIYLKVKEKDFYFISLTKREDKEDWIGDGKFEYSRVSKCFQVTQASPGCIYSKCLNWSDYKYEFEFKLMKTCLGAVLRAVNLSNYVMMQITQTGIRPHVLVNGGWMAWEANTVNLEFPKELSFEEWYKCQLVCDKNTIHIKILRRNKKILDREWQLPQGVLAFSFKKDEEDTKPINIPFPINLEYGSAGFRNFGDEKALVKNVLFEKI
jgi:hypothetical protein